MDYEIILCDGWIYYEFKSAENKLVSILVFGENRYSTLY